MHESARQGRLSWRVARRAVRKMSHRIYGLCSPVSPLMRWCQTRTSRNVPPVQADNSYKERL